MPELPPKPKVGLLVCDCKFQHIKIIKVIDEDTVVLADGSTCSYNHCCDRSDHKWNHPL